MSLLPSPLRPGPLLLGHRGAPRRFRENTLAGFQAALDAGLDGVELDVRQLQDGHLVIHHDLHLPGGPPLTRLTLRQLREVQPYEVPLLDEVLAWAADTGAYVNVEIKYEVARPGERVWHTLSAIRRHGAGRQVIVSSFNPLVLAAARQLDASLERGFLYHKPYALGPASLVPPVAGLLDVAALHPHHSLVDAALMETARRRGWRVNAWTVNEPADVARLNALGVDALIGDLPETLLGGGPEEVGSGEQGVGTAGVPLALRERGAAKKRGEDSVSPAESRLKAQ